MDLDALSKSPIGQLVPIHGTDARHGPFAYFAFLPAPLPLDVELESATWTAISDASVALGRLDQVCKQLPSPKLLIRPALWREALDTSALEGTHGLLRDLLEAQLPNSQFLSPQTTEIRAYFDMASYAFDVIGDRPISSQLLSELQTRLFEHSVNPPRDLGRVRREQVWVGPQDRPIADARFVPPPPGDQLRAGLDAWESWVSAKHAHFPALLRAALAHYQFETLHPFCDGNGRLGRLIVLLQLLTDGALVQPALTVSAWFLKRRDAYQNHLLATSCTGDWNPWVSFFCEAVADQCAALCDGAERLLSWQERTRKLIHERRWTGSIYQLLDDLTSFPVISITDAAAHCGVSNMNATRMIGHLVEIGVLTELTGGNYARLFGAVEVMNIVDMI